MNRGGLYRLDLSCFLTIRSDATKPAIISVVVFLSIANQTMVMSDNIVVISSEIPIMTLNDNASIEVDNIHLGSFMNDSEFSYFLSSLKSDETSHLWHMRLSIPLQIFVFICLLNMFLLNVLPMHLGKAKDNHIHPQPQYIHTPWNWFKWIYGDLPQTHQVTTIFV